MPSFLTSRKKTKFKKLIRNPWIINIGGSLIVLFIGAWLYTIPKPSDLSITFDRRIYDIFDNISFRLVNNGDIEALTRTENTSVVIHGSCSWEAKYVDEFPEIFCEDENGNLKHITKFEPDEITIAGKSSRYCILMLNIRAAVCDINTTCDFNIYKISINFTYSDINSYQLKIANSSVPIGGSSFKGPLKIENNTILPFEGC